MRIFFALAAMLASCVAVAETERHYVLVHGGGPSTVVGLKKMRSHLIAMGLPAASISLPTYDYRESLDDIDRAFKAKLKPILEAHASVVIITHSLGDFVALRALLELGMEHKVTHFIALGGVAHGQDEGPKSCAFRPCPPYVDALTPYRGPFSESLWSANPLPAEGLKHCAVYSLDDKRVHAPSDAAAFTTSTKVVLKGYSHWDLATDRRVLELALQGCGVPSPNASSAFTN